jgi:hypothetical protein
MNTTKRLSLKKRIDSEAERIEYSVTRNLNMQGIKVSETMENTLLSDIQAYEQEANTSDV